MGLLLPKNTSNESKKFNGIRRTPEGMLYLTSIDPNVDNDSIQYSNFFEEGKSDSVPKDGSNYTEERLEIFNVQYFTGDGSTLTFTLNATGMNANGIAVFVDNVRKTAFADYSVSGTTLTFVLKPANNTLTLDKPINLESNDVLRVLAHPLPDSSSISIEAYASILEIS